MADGPGSGPESVTPPQGPEKTTEQPAAGEPKSGEKGAGQGPKDNRPGGISDSVRRPGGLRRLAIMFGRGKQPPEPVTEQSTTGKTTEQETKSPTERQLTREESGQEQAAEPPETEEKPKTDEEKEEEALQLAYEQLPEELRTKIEASDGAKEAIINGILKPSKATAEGKDLTEEDIEQAESHVTALKEQHPELYTEVEEAYKEKIMDFQKEQANKAAADAAEGEAKEEIDKDESSEISEEQLMEWSVDTNHKLVTEFLQASQASLNNPTYESQKRAAKLRARMLRYQNRHKNRDATQDTDKQKKQVEAIARIQADAEKAYGAIEALRGDLTDVEARGKAFKLIEQARARQAIEEADVLQSGDKWDKLNKLFKVLGILVLAYAVSQYGMASAVTSMGGSSKGH